MAARKWAGLTGQAGVVLLLAMGARGAGAAVPECWGKWHLELARPTADKEAWLSPASWCRGATLPRTLDLDVRRGASGGLSMTGAPLAPTDVLVGAGTCTFAFSGADSHVPPNYELTIEAAAQHSKPDAKSDPKNDPKSGSKNDAKVEGSARCSEKTPGANGSTGITVSVPVNGTMNALGNGAGSGDAGPPAVDTRDLVASVAHACGRRDAEALWNLATPRFQAATDERAAQVRAAVPPSDLRRLYGFQGKPATFTGRDYLRYAIKSGKSAENPCADATRWKIEETRELPEERTVAIKRPDGSVFGLTFVRDERGWKLDQLSKSLPPKR